MEKEILEISREILDYVSFASDNCKYDNVRVKIADVKSDNVYEMYEKARTKFFSLDDRIKILKGYYLLTGDRISNYYFKALKLVKEATK